MKIEYWVQHMMNIEIPDKYEPDVISHINKHKRLTWDDMVDIAGNDADLVDEDDNYEPVPSGNGNGNSFYIEDDNGDEIYSQ